MGDCEYPECSGDSTMQHSCSYCGFDYCGTHRLPERHNCPALSTTNTLGPDFRGEFDVTTATPNQEARCSNCRSAHPVFGEEFCEDCLELQTGTREKSPDVKVEGPLADQTVRSDAPPEQRDQSRGILARLKSVFRRD